MQRQKEVERKGPREAEERKTQIVNESTEIFEHCDMYDYHVRNIHAHTTVLYTAGKSCLSCRNS